MTSQTRLRISELYRECLSADEAREDCAMCKGIGISDYGICGDCDGVGSHLINDAPGWTSYNEHLAGIPLIEKRAIMPKGDL